MSRLTHRLTYASWQAMRGRCNYPKEVGYSRYGGRGIKVCDRWNSFAAFLEDMGERPSRDHTIDRINNDGDYEPANCRWATKAEQRANVRPYTETPLRANSTSGAKGVSRRGNAYRAQITIEGVKRHLGTFPSKDAAARAYEAAQAARVSPN